MRINKILIDNFRQFKGENVVVLSDESMQGRNIDIFIGENGAGKTTLLSALHFAFHGEILDSLEEPDRLSHMDEFQTLQDGEETEVKVEVEFSHRGELYALQRVQKIRKNGQREQKIQEELSLLNVGDGKFITPAARWINSWFPPNLAKFFFFPGEHLDEFFDDSKFDRFVEDIKSISGLDKVDLTLAAGGRVLDRLQKRISQIPGDAEATTIVAIIEGLQEKLHLDSEEAASSKESHKAARTELKQIQEYLSKKQDEIGVLADLAKADLSLVNLESERNSLLVEITTFMQQSAWVPFTQSSGEAALTLVQSFAGQGLLDGSWSKDLIRELISQGNCICGSSLHRDTSNRKVLENLINSENIIQAPQRYDTVKRSVLSGILSVPASLNTWDDIQDRSLKNSLSIEETLAYRARLAQQTVTESKDAFLEAQLVRRQVLEAALDDLKSKEDGAAQQLEETEARLKIQNTALSNAKTALGQHGALIRQHQALVRVLKSIKSDSTLVGARLRAAIEDELHTNLSGVHYFDDVTITVDEHFHINLSKHGSPFPEAQGQRTARAFCLVLALNKIASSISLESQLSIPGGGAPEFPLVIDAGFGTLSANFMEQVVTWLKASNSQVILLLLNKDADSVLKLLDTNSKDAFLLHMRKSASAKNVSVEHRGRQVQMISFNSDANQTQIEVLEK